MTSPHSTTPSDTASEDPPTFFVRAAHTAWRRIGSETVVLDQKQHRLVALNGAGGNLWHRLDVPRGVEQLTSDDDGSVRTFLEELAALGLVERTTNGDAPRAANDDAPEGARVESVSVEVEPAILWQEAVQNAAQTSACAFLPGQNALCDGVPFS